MSLCPNCGLQRGLHHSILPGCLCTTASPFTYAVQQPQREWVELTDEQREKHRNDWHSNIHDKEFKAIEAKLKEKNT